MNNLDKLDQKLLFELDKNSRQKTSALARTIREGRDKIEYRIERLQKQGIINAFTTILNPNRLGGSMYKIYLKALANNKKREEFRKELQKHPRTFWIAESDGRWDLMFSFIAKSPMQFYQYQTDLFKKFSSLIQQFEVYPLIDATFYSKDYLCKKSGTSWTLGGDIIDTSLDDIDNKILKNIARQARLSSSEISRLVDTSIDIVNYRIKKLEENGIILGYRTEINLPALKLTFFKAQIFLNGTQPKKEREFASYCSSHPNIVYYIRQIGSCQLEIELEVKDYYQYFQIIDQIRTVFPTLIATIETSLIRRQEYKHISSVR